LGIPIVKYRKLDLSFNPGDLLGRQVAKG
jgi:hypothetical protein